MLRKENKKKMLIILIITFFILFYFNFINLNGEKINNYDPEDNKNNNLKLAQELGTYSGIGGAQNVTEYGEGTFTNNNINVSKNEDASIIVPDGWKAEQLQFDITDLYEYDKKWIDDKFDTGYNSDYWSTETQSDNVTFGWYDAPSGSNDSIYIRFEESGSTVSKKAYWNYTFNLPREQVPFEDWVISFNYRVLYSDSLWLAGSGGAANVFQIHVNGITQAFDQSKLDILVNDTWYQDNIIPFKAEPYNFNLPGTISLIFGIDYKNYDQSPTGNFEIYYDNITLQLSTLPKPSQIGLNITDITNGQETAIIDGIDPIIGTVDLFNTWVGSTGGTTHFFSFNHNSTGIIVLNSEFYSKAISSKKTRTILGLEGSEFTVENNSLTTWTYYFPVNIPGSYSNNYYFNISKPINWNVTQLINPYGSNKINDVLETAGYGNTTLIIPNDIISNGIWKVIAKAPNYIDAINIFKKVDSLWYKNTTFQEHDQLKVNITVNSALIPNLETTNATLLIYYPNGTLWYQTSNSLDVNGFVEFSGITLGAENTTIGVYTAQVQWNNLDSNMTQIGMKEVTFTIYHNSLLKISNYHASNKLMTFSGEYVIIKVNYTDLYTGNGIDNADISYIVHNDTIIEGSMIYQGGGIYFAEINTENLQIGSYNITFSATKAFYQSHYDIKLFELEIQLYTTLIRVDYPTFTQMNDNISISFIYKDSYDNGISGAEINLDISQEFINPITDFGNGSYLISFSSSTFGSLGRHQVLFNFSALGYETQMDTIQFEIIEQNIALEVSLNSNSLASNEIVNLYFTESINITVRAFATIDNKYLNGSIISLISDKFEENLTESPESYYSTNITLNGVEFNAGLNFIFIRFEKQNYQTSIFSFQIFLRAQDIILSLYLDSAPIEPNHLLEKSFKEIFNISCQAFATVEAKFLTGGNMTLVNGEHELLIPELTNSWFNTSITISSDFFSLGPNYVYVRFEQSNYTTTAFPFQMYIKSQNINLTIQTKDQDVTENPLIECYYNEVIQLSCRAYAEIETIYLSGGNITFVNNEQEIIIPEVGDYWFNSSILISSDYFSLGPNYVYIKFEQPNYITTTFSFQILVKQIEIQVSLLKYQNAIEGTEGEKVLIQLRLTEELSSNIIVNATLFYSWIFKTGTFEYTSNGTYQSEINLPIGYTGNRVFRVTITTNNTIYKSREYSIIITITPREIPNYVIWIIIGALAIGIGVLGALSLRSYVILPKKRKKEAELLDKVQVYKDVKNMQALMIIQKNSGLPIYTQEIRIFGEENDSFLVSGFVQAITNFSEVLIKREFDKSEETKDHSEYAKHIIELDFKLFQLLVCDYGVVRNLIFLKDTSSERLKKQLYYLTLALNTQYSEQFTNFTGDIKLIKDDLIFMINQFLSLHYIEPFEVNRDLKYVNVVLNSKELTKMETRLFNVITSITSKNKEFNLQIPIEQIHEKDENLVLEALDTLIKKKLIVSIYSEKLKGKNNI